MKVGIIGGGFTGITAAYYLQKAGHQAIVLEKESYLGGLAGGIKNAIPNPPENWEWDLEQYYHHWFTNDAFVFKLGEELGVADKFIKKHPQSHILYKDKTYPLDSALALLKFPHLSLVDRVKTGLTLAQLKYRFDMNSSKKFENITADEYLRKHSSKKAYELIWKPLLVGKFADKYKEVNMRWFWARVYKRTSSLVYYQGGFSAFLQDIADASKKLGADIKLKSSVQEITKKDTNQFSIRHETSGTQEELDVEKVIVTTPPNTLPFMLKGIPEDYKEKLKSHEGVGALVIVLRLHHPILDDTYWLSVNDINWPFLAVVEHTNFMPKEKYAGERIIYIGDYLEKDHPNMQKSKEELIEMFTPYIKKINPLFSNESIIDSYLFKSNYAQPIPKLNHQEKILPLKTPITGLFLATMAQVYPWDRGTNYSIEMGKKVVEQMLASSD